MPRDPSSNVLDLILAVAALVTIYSLVRSWRAFWDDDFTLADRRLATQAAVFVIPPAVVMLHELGHYFAAVAVGVRVIGFHYGLFEGSVTVAGFHSFAERWFIALAGNAVTALIALGMVVAALAGATMRRPLRYVLLAAGLLELVFSLIAYPVLSLTTRFGDWVAIYDTRHTRGLSAATAVVHAGLLFGLWRWWRRTGRATLFAIGTGSEQAVRDLQAAVRAAPRDPARRLELADFYARRSELGLARSAVEEGLAACGDSSRLLLGLARLSMFQGRWNDAVIAARRGLASAGGHAGGRGADADDDVRQRLWANLALALTQMERADHALPAYAELGTPLTDDVRVRYGRGLVRVSSGDLDGGRADLQSVVTELPEGNLLRRWAEARLAGHPLTEWDDSHLPKYQRGGGPPPAPLAGL